MTDRSRITEQAGRQLDDILSRTKYIGREPRPGEEELMDIVVNHIRVRRPSNVSRRSGHQTT